MVRGDLEEREKALHVTSQGIFPEDTYFSPKNHRSDHLYRAGAYGYAMEYDVQRYVRDVLLFPIIGGSSAIQRNNIANRLGLAKG